MRVPKEDLCHISSPPSYSTSTSNHLQPLTPTTRDWRVQESLLVCEVTDSRKRDSVISKIFT